MQPLRRELQRELQILLNDDSHRHVNYKIYNANNMCKITQLVTS